MHGLDARPAKDQTIDRPNAASAVPLLESAASEPIAENSELAAVLSDHGTLLYRDALPPRAMAEMEHMAREGFQRLVEHPDKCPSQHEFYRQYRSVIPFPLDVHLGTNFLQVLALLGHSPILPILERYFGTDDLVVPFGSMLARYVEPRSDDGPVEWRQDGYVTESTRLVTCWIPFSPCGFAAPGLKIALPSPLRIIDASEFPDRTVDESRWHIWNPVCRRGDVILFDPFMLHGTHFHKLMRQPRYSLEIRVTSSEFVHDLPAERIHYIYDFSSGNITDAS